MKRSSDLDELFFAGRKRLLTTIAAVLLGLLVVGCHMLGHQQSTDASPIVVMAFFDTSDLTDEVQKQYRSIFRNLVGDNDDGNNHLGTLLSVDRKIQLSGARITEATAAHANFVMNAEFPETGGAFGENALKVRGERVKLRDQCLEALEKLLKEPAKGSDIMSAFLLAGNTLSGNREAEKHVIIFSDLIEQSTAYDFASLNLTPDKIQEIIRIEKDAGRLPDLSGVSIWTIGVGGHLGRSGPPLPSKKIQEVKEFWLAYFQAAGATVDKSRLEAGMQFRTSGKPL